MMVISGISEQINERTVSQQVRTAGPENPHRYCRLEPNREWLSDITGPYWPIKDANTSLASQ